MKQKTGFIVSTLIMMIVIVILGPMDVFTHGYFCDEIDCSQIAEEDFKDRVNLGNQEYEMTFSPQKPYMTGFEIYLTAQPDENTGTLYMTVMDLDRNVMDNIEVDLNKVIFGAWYKVYTHAELQEGKQYLLRFSAEDCATASPCLQNVDNSYLPDETLSGNILLTYAYAESTFTFQTKVILSMFIIAVWLAVVARFLKEDKRNLLRLIAVGLFLTSVLTWNYMYNSMDNQNSSFFSDFQEDSETLVTGVIYAEQDDIYYRTEDGYGLGRYCNLRGQLNSYSLNYRTDDIWLNGYAREDCALIVDSNKYSKRVAVAGNFIEFPNGEVFQIVSIEDDDDNIVIYLNSDKVLTSEKYGNLDDARFYTAESEPLEFSWVIAYKSQYGLQGKVFRHLARYMEADQVIANLHLLCSVATALVFVLITMLLAVKYNTLMAGCFFMTFWLSPWIVNFARNLYWVEFTWFIPMLAGLFCAWKINHRKYRMISYMVIFVAIFGKCLCGYEYISTVMLGLIAFLLSDLICSVFKKDKEQFKLLFRTIMMIGIMALLGFMAAICIHATLRGNGSIAEGIRNIFEHDASRSTVGGDLNNLWGGYGESFNVSIWEVYSGYFHFRTEVITGIAGNFFPLLCVIPLFIFVYEYKVRRFNIELAVMYIVFFLTSISWFCLAREHSFRHTYLNYVLWYFGFVQICLYIIVNKIREIFHKAE